MKKQILTLVVGIVVGGGVFGATSALASTPRPSGYCSKAEIGKVAKYTPPSGKTSYNLKCTVVPTQKWKRA